MIGYQSFLHVVFDLSSGCKCFVYGQDLTGVINGHRLRAQYAQLRSGFKIGFNFTCQKPGSVHRQAVSGGKQIQKVQGRGRVTQAEIKNKNQTGIHAH